LLTTTETTQLLLTACHLEKTTCACKVFLAWSPLVFARPKVEPTITQTRHAQTNTTRRAMENLRNGKTAMNVMAAGKASHSHKCTGRKFSISRTTERL
jgi:hypothetical protein